MRMIFRHALAGMAPGAKRKTPLDVLLPKSDTKGLSSGDRGDQPGSKEPGRNAQHSNTTIVLQMTMDEMSCITLLFSFDSEVAVALTLSTVSHGSHPEGYNVP